MACADNAWCRPMQAEFPDAEWFALAEAIFVTNMLLAHLERSLEVSAYEMVEPPGAVAKADAGERLYTNARSPASRRTDSLTWIATLMLWPSPVQKQQQTARAAARKVRLPRRRQMARRSRRRLRPAPMTGRSLGNTSWQRAPA